MKESGLRYSVATILVGSIVRQREIAPSFRKISTAHLNAVYLSISLKHWIYLTVQAKLHQVKLSFLPADLHLRKEENGYFTVSLQGNEILRCRSGQKAITLFNKLKKECEEKFPAHDLSPEAKAAILQSTIGDELVKHNSLRTEQKKKPARSRTFG